MTDTAAVALLSGGLDSTVSLAVSLEQFQFKRALFFQYGQRAFQNELRAVGNICNHYGIPVKVVTLDWLKEITTTSLVNEEEVLPGYSLHKLDADITLLRASAKAVWVPNRNGVMLNIAGAFAESLECQFVSFGANKEEAVTFADNSREYVESLNISLAFSTASQVKVWAPLAEKTKTEIVNLAVQYNVPLQYLWSCYSSLEKHCGQCESCNRLKRALLENALDDVWKGLCE